MVRRTWHIAGTLATMLDTTTVGTHAGTIAAAPNAHGRNLYLVRSNTEPMAME